MMLYGGEIMSFKGQLLLFDRPGGPLALVARGKLGFVSLLICNWHTKPSGFWNGRGVH